MNCRPGDLAVIIGAGRGATHLIGRVITVSTLSPLSSPADPCWLYSPPLRFSNGSLIDVCNDRLLRPLRDQPGQDEMLRIAGLPAPRDTTTT